MISEKKEMKEPVLRNYQSALDGFKEIIQAAAKSPKWLEIMTIWSDLTRTHVEEIETKADLKPSSSLKQIVNRLKEYRPLQQKVAALADRATLLYKIDSLEISALQEQQRDIGKTVTSILTWGILLNFFVGLAMLSSFSNDIKKRVNLLVENAGHLGDNKPIGQLISGSDELAYLDLIFHHAQEQLLQAASERAAMMSMLASEMAHPLKEAKQSLSVIEENEKGKLTEKQMKQ